VKVNSNTFDVEASTLLMTIGRNLTMTIIGRNFDDGNQQQANALARPLLLRWHAGANGLHVRAARRI
jgi:hypothetical protein